MKTSQTLTCSSNLSPPAGGSAFIQISSNAFNDVPADSPALITFRLKASPSVAQTEEETNFCQLTILADSNPIFAESWWSTGEEGLIVRSCQIAKPSCLTLTIVESCAGPTTSLTLENLQVGKLEGDETSEACAFLS